MPCAGLYANVSFLAQDSGGNGGMGCNSQGGGSEQCKDSGREGIPDIEDKFKDVPGIREYQGCTEEVVVATGTWTEDPGFTLEEFCEKNPDRFVCEVQVIFPTGGGPPCSGEECGEDTRAPVSRTERAELSAMASKMNSCVRRTDATAAAISPHDLVSVDLPGALLGLALRSSYCDSDDEGVRSCCRHATLIDVVDIKRAADENSQPGQTPRNGVWAVTTHEYAHHTTGLEDHDDTTYSDEEKRVKKAANECAF